MIMASSGPGLGSYAVVWAEPDGALNSGSLTMFADGLRLEGRRQRGTQLVSRLLHAGELFAVRISRDPRDLVAGERALLLELAGGETIRISATGPGVLGELAHLLDAAREQQIQEHGQALVIVPLRKGASERARELIRQGPPFDPDKAGLDHHEVFLTEREAIFLFRGPNTDQTVQHLAADPALWRAATAWRTCINGKPRIADTTYTWNRS
jgi:hypothetical protein